MRIQFVGVALLVASMTFGLSSAIAASVAPVAKLVQVEGDVQYSRNGTSWRPVMRTKYLFPGYQIKTGADGSGKLINQLTGKSRDLGAGSLIAVNEEEIEVLAGSVTKAREESVSLWDSLVNKFAKAQRYTTVRRSVNGEEQSCDNKVRTIRNVTLSPSHPDLVWRNACPEYSYRLVVEGKAIDIPAQSTAEMIRYSVSGLEPGIYNYHVEVLDKDGTVYIPRDPSSFTLLSKDEERKLLTNLNEFEDDIFLTTNLYESNDMHVAAMDEYREYFNEYPDDNDMRPLLIQSYQDLKLSNLREREARLYNASQEENY
ncbi:MAG: hypothetical protein WD002_00185 [Pseudomonadales bacterium]